MADCCLQTSNWRERGFDSRWNTTTRRYEDWRRVVCLVCGRFLGYRPPESNKPKGRKRSDEGNELCKPRLAFPIAGIGTGTDGGNVSGPADICGAFEVP